MRAKKHSIPHKSIVLSMSVAILMLVARYLINNSNSRWLNQLLWNEKQYSYYLFQKTRGTCEDDKQIFEKVRFVDVSNTITIIEKQHTDDGVYREVITDREVLLEFLRKIENYSYDFLFLDIRFEEGDTTPCDSVLVEQLLKMSKKSNVAIARSYDNNNDRPVPLIDNRLDSIAFFVNYDNVSYDKRFSKYDYIQHGNNSIALEMYQRTHNGKKSIVKKGCLYFDGWRLSNNSKALAFHLKNGLNSPPRYPIEELLDEDSYYFKNLSEQIGGKYIIVGDLGRRDLAGTYLGEQPGAVINWIAYKTLIDGKHKINLVCVFILFAAYFGITYFILEKVKIAACIRNRIARYLPKLSKNPVVQFLCSLVGYSTILWPLSLVLYLLFEVLYFPVVPTIVFSLVSNGVRFSKKNNVN